uniref:Uncharacterized protein n=1 Tax=Arundo donax TaxID=35708 RepID=A0A0A9FPJ6_ARUDO
MMCKSPKVKDILKKKHSTFRQSAHRVKKKNLLLEYQSN